HERRRPRISRPGPPQAGGRARPAAAPAGLPPLHPTVTVPQPTPQAERGTLRAPSSTTQYGRVSIPMSKKLTLLGVACAVTLGALAAILGAATTANATRTDDQLVGAGSSFVAPLVSQWQNDYQTKTGVQIVYSPIGSGGGISAISARTVDFGASDAPLTPDQFDACKGCVQIPWALSATSIAYNLNGVKNNLKMTGPVLARIFLGDITQWDDAAIK